MHNQIEELLQTTTKITNNEFINGELVTTEDSPRASDESKVILAFLSVLFYSAKISNEFTYLIFQKYL